MDSRLPFGLLPLVEGAGMTLFNMIAHKEAADMFQAYRLSRYCGRNNQEFFAEKFFISAKNYSEYAANALSR